MPAYMLQSNGLRSIISAIPVDGFKRLAGPMDAGDFKSAQEKFRKAVPNALQDAVAAATPVGEDQPEGVFDTMHEALTFAFRFAHQQFPRTPMTVLLQDGRLGSGRGLVGIDGAGEAGSVLGHVQRLASPLERAAIICRHAVPVECAHCKSLCPGAEYLEAVELVAHEVLAALKGQHQNLTLRRVLVKRYFGSRMKMGDVAEHCGVHRDTANNHYRLIKEFLVKVEERAMANLEAACGRMLKSEGQK